MVKTVLTQKNASKVKITHIYVKCPRAEYKITSCDTETLFLFVVWRRSGTHLPLGQALLFSKGDETAGTSTGEFTNVTVNTAGVVVEKKSTRTLRLHRYDRD